MRYPEYKQVNYAQIGQEVLEFWEEENIFEKSIRQREGNPSFTFYEGPPSANGTPGIHHVMARTVKDIFCRYKTLKGFQVKRKGGWDTHGLPVELQVEKELGITKEDIGKTISVEQYNQKCREAVMKFKNEWDHLTELMGYWVDLDDPYITFEADYMESLWHLLKRLYDKNLLYKGYTIQPYSPAAGTGLSSHELNQPGCYRDVKDTSITAQFKVKHGKGMAQPGDYLLAWTTTPWTLSSNAALAVGKNIQYIRVQTYNPYTHQTVAVILAQDRLAAYLNPKAAELPLENYQAGDKLIPYQITSSCAGVDLDGVVYEQLMSYVQPHAPAFRVIIGDFVTTEDGTGIVHIAPTFGADDQRVAQKAGIPPITVSDEKGKPMPLVDKQGRFVPQMGDLAGRYVKEEYYSDLERARPDFKPTDVLIAIRLKEEGKAFKVEKYEHSYPHCWRTDKPVLYYPLESWFIRTTAAKDQLVALNKTINWKPESTGTGRFGNWLENLVDWNLSRSRFWGTPLPIWRTEDGSEEICIGSIEELENEIQKAISAGLMKENPVRRGELSVEAGGQGLKGDDVPHSFSVASANNGDEPRPSTLDPGIDLHRPYVDQIILLSPTGQAMYREPDLVDVWFDSGAMPFAQWHYPFENSEVFEKSFPADFIAEGVDQTRGWFFTLHAIAVMLEEKVAFKNVIANGLVLDKNGNKMSKRLGNAIDPFKTIAQYGPDATRWYMISNANPWDNLKFDLEGVAEVQRRFFGTLHNTYNFFALYANLDGFTFAEEAIPLRQRTESDRWIISKLNSLIGQVDKAYDDYEPTRAARLIQDFTVDDLSNWYVRLNRKRFWVGQLTDDKRAAYQTLYTCLETLAHLASPIAPFYAERLFKDLNDVSRKEAVKSVHLSDFPQIDSSVIDLELEERMGLSQLISSLVHSLRKKDKLKVRQPLSRILIPVLSAKTKAQIQSVEEIIKTEVNIKAIEYISDGSGIVVKTVKPNFPKLGKQFGPRMKAVAEAISAMSKDELASLEKTGGLSLQVGEEVIGISLEDVDIRSQDIPGWSVVSDQGITVALDITLTDELRREGVARDLVNRIQNLRKDTGLEVQDKIELHLSSVEPLVQAAVADFKDYICTETQALSLDWLADIPEAEALEIDDYTVKIKLRNVKEA
ncbi:MAG: isoleucine--tRNA ligase [Cytophagales bacterium]|nr:isoleucine--tRNA ligase [Cytophagales bacterium]